MENPHTRSRGASTRLASARALSGSRCQKVPSPAASAARATACSQSSYADTSLAQASATVRRAVPLTTLLLVSLPEHDQEDPLGRAGTGPTPFIRAGSAMNRGVAEPPFFVASTFSQRAPSTPVSERAARARGARAARPPLKRRSRRSVPRLPVALALPRPGDDGHPPARRRALAGARPTPPPTTGAAVWPARGCTGPSSSPRPRGPTAARPGFRRSGARCCRPRSRPSTR
jgi:hypothetical protein